jgi:hypothetical protein
MGPKSQSILWQQRRLRYLHKLGQHQIFLLLAKYSSTSHKRCILVLASNSISDSHSSAQSLFGLASDGRTSSWRLTSCVALRIVLCRTATFAALLKGSSRSTSSEQVRAHSSVLLGTAGACAVAAWNIS